MARYYAQLARENFSILYIRVIFSLITIYFQNIDKKFLNDLSCVAFLGRLLILLNY